MTSDRVLGNGSSVKLVWCFSLVSPEVGKAGLQTEMDRHSGMAFRTQYK